MKNIFIKLFTLAVVFTNIQLGASAATEPFIGEIMMTVGSFCPRGWASAEGQTLPITQNTSLFAVIGTTYGGDGTTNFRLPDLRSRLPMGQGAGPGLTNRPMGEKLGTETIILTLDNLPNHNHSIMVKDGRGVKTDAANAFIAGSGIFRDSGTSKALNAATVSSAGGNQPFAIIPPYTTVRYCIALEGIFPSRN
ncbi:MAG: tail fiber protein [Candidatus Caenarcaniphilales bacterium]|jgi:microcystin-dependent protein|nr:tail fiber protein [Candidatus Caenarcaniphilales bacterium]